MMRVLVACEFSGIVRDAFRARGHEAISCDLLPTEREGPHLQCDVREIIEQSWDLVIAHPPCTYLCNSGVRWLYGGKGKTKDESRWQKMRESAEFFNLFLHVSTNRVCIENPRMHRYAKEIIKIEYSQVIQPYYFGHAETKATCLWLKNLPPLRPTKYVTSIPISQRVAWESPNPNRWKNRSRTLVGIAAAMAEQWGL